MRERLRGNCKIDKCTLILFILLVFGLLIRIWWDFRVDDAYITYRYAANLASGLGPVFNVGQHVEGYTSFLWMLVMSIPLSIGLDPLLTSRLISAFLGGATAWLMLNLASQFQKPSSGHFLAPALLFTSLPFVLYTESGMETILFATAVLGSTTATIATRRQPSRYFVAGVLWGVSALIRPEALLLVPLCFIASELSSFLGKPFLYPQRTLLSLLAHSGFFLLGFALLTMPHLMWRWSFYGDLLPNTYFAKMENLSLPIRIRRGFVYLYRSLRVSPACLLIGLGWLLATKRLWKQRVWQIISVMVVMLLLIILLEGGDWMPGARFLIPLLPFAFLLFTGGLVQQQLRSRRIPKTISLAALGFIALALNLVPHYTERARVQDYINNLDYREEMARWLASEIPSWFTIAYGDMGIVPYTLWMNRFIDINGLTDRVIARAEDKTSVAEYVLSQHPEIILMVAVNTEHPVVNPGPEILVATPYRPISASQRFWSEYDYVRSFPSFSSDSEWLGRARSILMFRRSDVSFDCSVR